MANVKFTDLPNLASITANTIIPVVDANVNYSVTTANLQSYVNNSTGNISTTGNVTGNYFIGNGSQLTGIVSSYGDSNVAAFLPTYTGNVTANRISATGNVSGLYFIGDGSLLTGVSNYGNSNVAAYLPTFTGNLNPNTVSATGNITAPFFFGNGSQLTGIVSTYGNANVVNLLSGFGTNTIVTSGNITAGNFFGNGAGLTNLPAGILAGNLTGNIVGNGFSMLNIATITSAGTISAAGNITGANINGNFTGSGANLSNIVTSIAAGPGISVNSSTGAVTITNNNATPYGNANVATFMSNYGSNTISTTGNITSGNVTVTGANARVSLLGSTSNKIYFNTQGAASPTVGSISPGAKLVLYDSIPAGPGFGTYAIGIDEFTMWFSTDTAGSNFEYYQGNTKIARIESYGIVANAVTYTGTAGTAGQVLTTYANGVTYWANTSSTLGNITTGTISASGAVTSAGNMTSVGTIQGSALIVTSDAAPANSGSAGTKGQIVYGNVGATWYIYVCVATNTWRRVALSTF